MSGALRIKLMDRDLFRNLSLPVPLTGEETSDGQIVHERFNQDVDRDLQSCRDAGDILCANQRWRDRINRRCWQCAGLATGHADYSWLDWSGALCWSALGNIAGGVGLVTSIRLLRVRRRLRLPHLRQLRVHRPEKASVPR